MYVLWLAVFWAMQVIAQVLFKYGSGSHERWLLGFVGGNVFGASSTWILMLLYRAMNPNVALGLAIGGGFLFGQIALTVIFRSGISVLQSAAVLAITVGIVLLLVGNRG